MQSNIPTYSTPEQAVRTYMYMNQYSRNLELLYQTPEELPIDSVPPRRPINVIIKEAAKENREILTETEAKRLLENYNIPNRQNSHCRKRKMKQLPQHQAFRLSSGS